MKNILAAVDGSDSACRAARFAAELAAATGGTLTLIYVYDAPGLAAMGFAGLAPDELEAKKQDIAKGSFDAAERAFSDIEVTAWRHASIGHPAEVVLGHADEIKADLVVLGSRGLSPVRGVVLGSVSNRVLQRAKCPVTIVH